MRERRGHAAKGHRAKDQRPKTKLAGKLSWRTVIGYLIDLNMKYKLRTHKQFRAFGALRMNKIISKSVQYLTCVCDVQPLNYMVTLVSLLWTSCMFSFFILLQNRWQPIPLNLVGTIKCSKWKPPIRLLVFCWRIWSSVCRTTAAATTAAVVVVMWHI